jgi:hypothetical protein
MRLFFFESFMLSNTVQQIICSQFDRGHKVNAFVSAILPSVHFEILIFWLPACVLMAAFLPSNHPVNDSHPLPFRFHSGSGFICPALLLIKSQ